jgi:hypothetical protein
VILDNGDSDDAGARDEAEGASGDIDTGCIEPDASLFDTFAISELASEPHGMPSASAQAQPQTFSQTSRPLQDQTNQQDVDDITQSTSVEFALHSLPKLPDSGDDGWTEDSMTELEKELGLAWKEQQVESSSAGTPTSPSPRSAEAPQDETQIRERTENTGSRPEELQDTSRHGTAQGLEEWEQQETEVVVEGGVVAIQQQEEFAAQNEELGQLAVGDQQDLFKVVNADPEDKEATEALPAAQPKTFEIGEHRFRLRGVRARQLAGRQTKTTQYRVVWGNLSNRSGSWFNEDDVQISVPCEPDSQDLALQVHVIRVRDMRPRLCKGRKVFEYLVDMCGLDSPTWTTEDQLRISLNPMLVAQLKGN